MIISPQVRQRIHFKILLITYKSIKDMAPEYLCELVSIRKSSRKLRSSSQIAQVPVSRLKSYGDCAFSVAAPNLWNRLPANIRNASSLENFKSLIFVIYCRAVMAQIERRTLNRRVAGSNQSARNELCV